MAIDMAALRAKALANAARVLAEEKKNDENTTSVSVPSPVLATAPIVSTSPAVSRNMAILESSIATANSMVPVSSTGLASKEEPEESVELTPQQFSVVEKIEELKQKLLTNDPAMERLLKQIHTAIHKDPELAHFLKPDQIGAIVKGCMYVTKVVIVTTATKKATTASGKKLSNLTLEDI